MAFVLDTGVVEARFGALLDSMPDGIVMVNSDGLIALVNNQAESLFGYTRGELRGQPIEILLPARLRAAHVSHRSSYVAQPRVRSMGAGLELNGVRKDGTEFAVEISLSPIVTDGGTLVMSAIRDISERKRIEHMLQEKNAELHVVAQAKDRFLANMSHELRTPLNAIIGFAELMHNGKLGPVSEPHKEYLGDILSSARHLEHLINDVLDLAKVGAGKIDLQAEQIDLSRLVGEVRDALRSIAAKKNLSIELRVAPELRSIVGDSARIKQILYNYLSNALKFSPENGLVHVRCKLDGESYFRIEVEDHGIGIAAHDLERLFVEFQQLDAGSAKRYQGTGLGLALTKRLAEAKGGHVEVRSEPGHGSVFSVVLPRVLQVVGDRTTEGLATIAERRKR
jgi:PAS domain S-box-containing protein